MSWQDNTIQLLSEAVQRAAAPAPGTSEAMLYHHVKLTDALSDMREGRNADSWLLSLENALEDLVDAMKNAPSAVHLAAARLVYTDCCLALAIANDLTASPSQGIRFLDKAIIVSGPSGPGRVEIVQDIIRELQSLLEHPDPFVGIGPRPRICGVADSTASTIPVLERHPSFAAFQEKYSNSPFIIRGFASSWPALTDHPWRSAAYLKSIAGPGRIVPVEVGEDYRSESWHQELMNWDEFLSHLDLDGCQLSAPHDGRKLYLAQYDLARQFPVLLDDILVPDYVYSVLCPEYKKYRPPQNAENLIINMWLGPAATMSPAHIDPYYNIYVQVVGRKKIWLAPPKASAFMATREDGVLGNTSQVDVFAAREDLLQQAPDYCRSVLPTAMEAILNPGDMLFFPPGWWHAMKSCETSFSVSMWF